MISKIEVYNRLGMYEYILPLAEEVVEKNHQIKRTGTCYRISRSILSRGVLH